MKQGFTMVEMLLVMAVITLVSTFTLHVIVEPTEYIDIDLAQLEAMYIGKTKVVVQGLSFNMNGNINHAQTRTINNKKCIFQLGFGRYRCE